MDPGLLAAQSAGELARGDLGMASILLAVAGWVIFLLARARWGSDHPPRSDEDGEAEFPDDSPAVAHALHAGGEAGPEVLGVILLDLARRGYVEISELGPAPAFPGPGVPPPAATGWRFRRSEPPQGELRPYENALYTRLFVGGSDTTLAALGQWVDANRQQAKVFLERVRRYVGAELRQEGYVEKPQRLPAILNLAASGLVIVVGLAALLSGAFVAVLAIGSGVLQASRNNSLRRRTAEGSTRARQWAAVADSMRAVASQPKPPKGGVKRWEELTVYAAALGVADEFLAGLHALVPGLEGFAPWYPRVSPDGAEVVRLATLPPEMAKVVAVADAPGWAAQLPGAGAVRR